MAVVQNHLEAGMRTPVARIERPDTALYSLWCLFWVLMVVIALNDYFRGGGTRWWQPVLWEGSSALGSTFWLVLQRRFDERYSAYIDQPLSWFGHHLKWLPLLTITFVVFTYSLRHAVYALLGYVYEHESWAYVFVYETIKLALFVSLWLGIIFGMDSFVQLREQRQRLLILQKSLAEAQLSQLKAQLRPHFFFNALNTISALMHADVERADRLLARLGDLLRSTLRSGEREMTTVGDEIRLLELYAQIMQERFGERVTIDWRIDEQTSNAIVPAFILQPLLENAFKHGVERSREHVHIEIEAARADGQLRLAIRNTGPALLPEFTEGVGLRNCRERLYLIYGAAASLRVAGNASGVEAGMMLPWRELLP